MNATQAAARRTVAAIANPQPRHRFSAFGSSRRARPTYGGWRDPVMPADTWLSFIPAVRHFPR